MTFTDAVGSCFRQYVGFAGRACRSEYWFFVLFSIIVNIGAGIIDAVGNITLVAPLVSLALFLPSLAVGVRRLHDIDRSGWWLLIAFVPLVGAILLLVWACTRGSFGSNRFGADPLPAPVGHPA